MSHVHPPPDRPHAGSPSATEQVLAAFLHRLASPLGAIANYAHLLPPGDGRQGILDAMASVRVTLDEAQRLLDALATAGGPVPAGGVDLEQSLVAALARRKGDVQLEVPRLPHARVPAAAAARIFDALLADAAGAAPEPGSARLTMALGPEPGVHLVVEHPGRAWSELKAARAFDLFPAAGSGSNDGRAGLPLVGSLVRRLGGRAWASVGGRSEAIVHLVLPMTAQGGAPAEEERRT